MSGQPWEASYQDGPAPWDIGGPQPAIVALAAEGAFTGTVLDAGCGTGANALHLAALGLPVFGVDVAGTAIAAARSAATARGLAAEFAIADALHLELLGRMFDTVIDSGLFHTFDATERADYVASLAAATKPTGTLHVLCFSDEGVDPGPHPVSRADLTSAFQPTTGWAIASIEAARVETRFHDHGAPAWLARIERR
jgi:SAM-dependent methyltransferase